MTLKYTVTLEKLLKRAKITKYNFIEHSTDFINIKKLLEDIYSYTFSQTDDLSFNNLGFMYRYGLGVTKNETKSLKLYNISASLNNIYAMRNLGSYYYLKNIDKSIEWYTKGAELGYLQCMHNLAWIYREKKEYTIAEKWYKKAILSKDNKEKDCKLLMKHNLACMYYEDLEKYEEAIILYNELLNDNDSEYFNKNDCLKRLNECKFKLRKLSTLYNNIQEDNCSCCLEPLMNTNNMILTLLCGHSFHYTCVKSCAKSCPICRNVIEF